ncbi:hypothetical protein BGZ80_004485, partial [Entomortierella chlamydospora]
DPIMEILLLDNVDNIISSGSSNEESQGDDKHARFEREESFTDDDGNCDDLAGKKDAVALSGSEVQVDDNDNGSDDDDDDNDDSDDDRNHKVVDGERQYGT